jgi:maltose O-acetyltransferase
MGEMRDRMLRGELYIAGDPENEAEFARVQELLAHFNRSAHGAWDERDALLRQMLRHVGEEVVLLRVRRDQHWRPHVRQCRCGDA